MEKKDYIDIFDRFLKKQATAEEVRQLIAWLKSDNSFSDWLTDEWASAPEEMDANLQRKLYREIKNKIASKQQEQPRYKRLQPAAWLLRVASVAVLLLVSYFAVDNYLSRHDASHDMEVLVDRGQKAQVVLPDGSKVWLNSASKLLYGSDFNDKHRILKLDGEAYFEVHADKARPFIVKTDNMQVCALGTSFNVKAYANDKEATTVLVEGSVEVTTNNHERTLLVPNEEAVIDQATGKLEKIMVEDARDYANWKNNVLTFRGETLENIVHTLERYYNTRIVFESDVLKQFRFTGTPANTSIESVLHILSLTSPLAYEITDSIIILREDARRAAHYRNAMKITE